jgi:hypothetical protein
VPYCVVGYSCSHLEPDSIHRAATSYRE